MKPHLWSEYFEMLMDFEGERYEHDPDDPGGATKFGIDQRSHPGVDIKNLTREGAERIYLNEFWACFAFQIPSPLALIVFDFRVTSGEGSAAKAIQRALGMGRIDGAPGPLTRAAIATAIANQGQAPLLASFTKWRITFYERVAAYRPRSMKYLRGWIKRSLKGRAWAENKLLV
jgi:lysozyme family protein